MAEVNAAPLARTLSWPPSPLLRRLWWGVMALVWGVEAWAAWWALWRHFPLNAVDFAQHYYLGWFVNQGGAFTDPTWPQQVEVGWPPWAPEVIPYLPYQALLLGPMRLLAHLPFGWAVALWAALGVLAWLGVAWAAARVLPWSPRRIATLLFAWPVLWHTLGLGNIDALLGAVMALALIALAQGSIFVSSLLVAWCGAFKPFLFLGALPGLRRSPRSALAGLALGGLSALTWAWLSVGTAGLRFLAIHLDDYDRVLGVTLPGNGSLTAWLAALGGAPVPLAMAGAEGYTFRGLLPLNLPLAILIHLAILLGLGLVAWAFRSTRRLQRLPLLEAGLWLTLSMLVTPVGWVNYQIYLALPLLGLLAAFGALPMARRYLILAVAPLLFLTNIPALASLLVAPVMLIPLVLGSLRLALVWLFWLAWRDLASQEP